MKKTGRGRGKQGRLEDYTEKRGQEEIEGGEGKGKMSLQIEGEKTRGGCRVGKRSPMRFSDLRTERETVRSSISHM